jgi:hypothetical protein
MLSDSYVKEVSMFTSLMRRYGDVVAGILCGLIFFIFLMGVLPQTETTSPLFTSGIVSLTVAFVVAVFWRLVYSNS